jgi:hypothetical protein
MTSTCSEQDGPGIRSDSLDDLIGGELPAVLGQALADIRDVGSGHSKHGVDVRPDGTDDEPMVSGGKRHLGRNRHAEHGGTRNGDPPFVQIDVVEPVEIGFQGRAELRSPTGVRIERLTRIQRSFGRFSNERRRDRIALSEPQWDHLGIAHALEGDLRDAVLLQRLYLVPEWLHQHQPNRRRLLYLKKRQISKLHQLA